MTARILVRRLLSRYAPVEAREWGFTTGPYGKPAVAAPRLPVPLFFNLSHTRGLVCCAVARREEIGVDVETIQRRTPGAELARRYFSRQEVADLFSLPVERQAAAFFDYWTLKEAYIKARGKGLAIPLDQFTFHLLEEGPPRISFSPKLDDWPDTWWFAQRQPSTDHRLALAARCRPGEVLSLVENEAALA